MNKKHVTPKQGMTNQWRIWGVFILGNETRKSIDFNFRKVMNNQLCDIDPKKKPR